MTNEREERKPQTVIEGQTLILDGANMKDLELRSSTLVYRGGQLPRLENVGFVSSSFKFEDAAERTLVFLTTLYAFGGEDVVEQVFESIRQQGKMRSPRTEHG